MSLYVLEGQKSDNPLTGEKKNDRKITNNIVHLLEFCATLSLQVHCLRQVRKLFYSVTFSGCFGDS